jgi:hypothetical protein
MQLILAKKIIYADSTEMENNFYKKIYIITLCNFLVQELVMT